jgi:transcriptional regulator with XRE-family HTH domain
MAEPREHPLTAGKDAAEPARVAGRPTGASGGSEASADSLIDERAAANIRAAREALGMSQGELARQMAAHGWPYYPQTVHRVESTQRKISIGEGAALAKILRTSLDRLTWPKAEIDSVAALDSSVARVLKGHEQVTAWARELIFALNQLRGHVARAEEAGYHGSDRVRLIAQEDAVKALSLTPESAVDEALADHEAAEEEIRQHNEWSGLVSTVIRDYTNGASIRNIAQTTPLTYGEVREILVEHGVLIRGGRRDGAPGSSARAADDEG